MRKSEKSSTTLVGADVVLSGDVRCDHRPLVLVPTRLLP